MIKFPDGFFELLLVLAVIGVIAVIASGTWLIVQLICWLWIHYT